MFRRGLMALVAISAAAQGAAVAKDHSHTFLDWIARGSPQAISAAAQEMRTSDGEDAELLSDALGRAMQVAPARVLPLVNSSARFPADRICVPFLSEDQPVPMVLRSLERSRQSIASVRDAELANQRAACLQVITRVEKAIRRR